MNDQYPLKINYCPGYYLKKNTVLNFTLSIDYTLLLSKPL